MILDALNLLRSELQDYLANRQNDSSAMVELGSVAHGADDKILLSLVNVEEEAALRNSSPYQRNATGGFDIVNPPVFLNLFVLVSVYTNDLTSYGKALKRLSWVVQCFQQKTAFAVATAPGSGTYDDESALRMRLSVDLYSLSFEKVSQLWTTLGGKQLPCVLYKVRLVEEQGPALVGQGPAISTIASRTGLVAPAVN